MLWSLLIKTRINVITDRLIQGPDFSYTHPAWAANQKNSPAYSSVKVLELRFLWFKVFGNTKAFSEVLIEAKNGWTVYTVLSSTNCHRATGLSNLFLQNCWNTLVGWQITATIQKHSSTTYIHTHPNKTNSRTRDLFPAFTNRIPCKTLEWG